MIEILEVKTKKQWKEFALFPINLYKDCPYYVPAFISDDASLANEKKNPPAINCIVKAFLAYKNGKIVGRIAGIIVNESNNRFNQKRVRISRFDFIDDYEVSQALINAVENFAKEYGMNQIHGPWGFNDTDREGMLTSGFDTMGSYATNYNFEYYNDHMRKMGFEKESGWIESKISFPKLNDRQYERFCKLGEYTKKKYKLREVCDEMPLKKIVKLYGDKFFDCYNKAYADLDMFIEIKDEVKKTVLKQFATMINIDYFSVVVDKNDEVVAFCVILPSFGKLVKKHGGKMSLPFIFELLKYLKNPDVLELTLIAVSPEFKKKGYTAVCIERMVKNIAKNNIDTVVSCPTLEDNFEVRAQWNALENEIIKTRQTYIKNI